MAQLSMDQRELVGEAMAISQQNKQNIEVIKEGLAQQINFSGQLYKEFDVLSLKIEKLRQLVNASEMQLSRFEDAANLDIHSFESLATQVFATGEWNETLEQIEEKIVNLESYAQALESTELNDIEQRVSRHLEGNEQMFKALSLRVRGE